MVRIHIDSDLCVGCMLCALLCPNMVLVIAGGYVAAEIDAQKCTLCMACQDVCLERAITVNEE